MNPRVVSLLLLVATVPSAVTSVAQSPEPTPIRFRYLKAITPGESSALSGECDGTTASPEITCRFTQLTVRHQLDPKDAPTEQEKRIAQLRSQAANDPRKFADQMCADVRKHRAEIDRALQDETNPRTRRDARDFLALCANPSLSAFEDWMRRAILAETRKCKVSVSQNETVKYKKVGPNKWVANVGPQGLCNSVYLYTMENDAKQSNLWKWSQVRTAADTSRELCKNTQLNYKREYSWEGDDPEISCDAISFGP